MSDFHAGDVVYVRPVGTADVVERIALTADQVTYDPSDNSVVYNILGYELVDLPGIWQSHQLELMTGGERRRVVEEHLLNRRGVE